MNISSFIILALCLGAVKICHASGTAHTIAVDIAAFEENIYKEFFNSVQGAALPKKVGVFLESATNIAAAEKLKDLIADSLIGEVVDAFARHKSTTGLLDQIKVLLKTASTLNSDGEFLLLRADKLIEEKLEKFSVDNSMQDYPENYGNLDPFEVKRVIGFAYTIVVELENCIEGKLEKQIFENFGAHDAAGALALFQKGLNGATDLGKVTTHLTGDIVTKLLNRFAAEVKTNMDNKFFGKHQLFHDFGMCIDWNIDNLNGATWATVRDEGKTSGDKAWPKLLDVLHKGN